MNTIVLVIAERARRDGKYTAYHDGRLIVEGSKQPFLESARLLLAQGLDPGARYVMRRSPDGPDALVSTLGKAAGLMIAEGELKPRFVPWTPSPFARNGP
jgi:hypothetical protein